MDERGISTALSYTMALGIVTLLLTGLVTGFAPMVTNQQAEATHATLEVVGNDLAGDIASADRLAVEAGSNGTVVLRTQLPRRVGGSPYEIDVREAGEVDGETRYELTLTSVDQETSVTVGFRSETDVEVGTTGPVAGGPLEITFDGDTLVVTEDA